MTTTTTTDTINYSFEMNSCVIDTINAKEYIALCKRRNCFEHLPNDRPIKLYLDVDIKYDVDDEAEGREYMEEIPRITGMLRNVLSGFFGEKYDHRQVCIEPSHHPYYRPYNATKKALEENYICKISLHFVINNIIALVSHQNILIGKLNAYANTVIDADDRENIFKNKPIFDNQPYKAKGQKIRSIYANKPLENRPLTLEYGTEEMSLITAFIPKDAYEWVEDIPERPVSVANDSIVRDAEKDRAIFNAGIELLKPYAQAGQYNDWSKIGWAIKNEFNDPVLFHTFSKLGGKAYNRSSVQDFWDTMDFRNNGEKKVAMGTIQYYMRLTDKTKADYIIQTETRRMEGRNILLETVNQFVTEDPDTDGETNSEKSVEYVIKTEKSYEQQYAEKEATAITKYIETKSKKFITGDRSSYNLALLFIEIFGHRFITCRETTYFYTGYVWKTCDKKLTDLHKFLTREFYMFIGELFMHWEKNYNKKLQSLTDEKEIKTMQDDIKGLGSHKQNIYTTLTTLTYRVQFVNEIVIQHTDNSIEFNAHNHLFAFKNAVFDLRKNEQIIPDPKHYISLYADYDYDKKYPATRKEELKKSLSIIHQNPEIREYYLSIMATGMIGDHLQYFFIFTGAGGNGKGLLNKLFMQTISNYGYKAPKTLFTADLKTGACPEIANMHQKRFVCSQEPDKGTKLRMDNIKEFTGEDEYNARQLYSGDTKTKANNTMCLEANTIPHTSEVGRAVERRLRIVPFMTNAIEKEDYDALEDKTNFCIKNAEYDTPEFREKYRQAFFEILRPYAGQYYKRGDIPEMPEICRKATNAHLAVSDDMNAWIEDNYEKCPNAEPIKLKTIYEHFKSTEAFLSLSKTQKREFNMAKFTNKLASSPFIAKYVKMRKAYHNKKQLDADSLVEWKLKTDDDTPVYVAEEFDMVDM